MSSSRTGSAKYLAFAKTLSVKVLTSCRGRCLAGYKSCSSRSTCSIYTSQLHVSPWFEHGSL